MKGYKILGKLGRGGMGVVYRALQESLNREVAIKFLPREYSDNPDLLARFRREIRACAKLDHPNIVRIIEDGRHDGLVYYVMEHIRGRSLLELLRIRGPFPSETVLRVAEDVLEACAYFHARGFVHRDLKPANVIVDEHGKAVVMDFGLVKPLDATEITRQGQIVGTPRYLSPELLGGHPVDGRSDLYQVGLILQELLTGAPVVPGKDREAMARLIMSEERRAPSVLDPRVPPALDNFILNALARDVNRRYDSAESMLADVRTLRAGGTVKLLPDRSSESRSTKPVDAVPGGSSRGMRRRRKTTRKLPPSTALELPADVSSSLWRPAMVVMGVVFVLAGALATHWVMSSGPESFVTSVVSAREGRHRVEIRWKTEPACPTRLEYRTETAQGWETALAALEEPTTDHEVVLAGLPEGSSYHYRFVYPGGSRSPVRSFRTKALELAEVSIQRRWPGHADLTFETTLPAACRIEWTEARNESGGNRPVRTVDASRVPARAHQATIPVSRPDETLDFRIVATPEEGDPRTFPWQRLPSVTEMALLLAQGLQEVPDSWNRVLQSAGGSLATSQIVDLYRSFWRTRGVFRTLEQFRILGPSFFSSPEVSLDSKLALFDQARLLLGMEHYARAAGMRLDTRIREMLGPDFSPGLQPRIGEHVKRIRRQLPRSKLLPSLPRDLRNKLPIPSLEEEVVREGLRLRFELTGVDQYTVAELSLFCEPNHHHNVFRVSINSETTLILLPWLPVEEGQTGFVFHTFDARLLREGTNRLVFTVESVRPNDWVPRGGRLYGWGLDLR